MQVNCRIMCVCNHNDNTTTTKGCSNWLQNQIYEGDGLHAVLHLSPTPTNTGPSTTTRGDIAQMSPANITLLCRRVMNAQIIGPKQTEILSITQRLLQGDMGCHDQPGIPGHTPDKKVIPPCRMTWRDSANASRLLCA